MSRFQFHLDLRISNCEVFGIVQTNSRTFRSYFKFSSTLTTESVSSMEGHQFSKPSRVARCESLGEAPSLWQSLRSPDEQMKCLGIQERTKPSRPTADQARQDRTVSTSTREPGMRPSIYRSPACEFTIDQEPVAHKLSQGETLPTHNRLTETAMERRSHRQMHGSDDFGDVFVPAITQRQAAVGADEETAVGRLVTLFRERWPNTDATPDEDVTVCSNVRDTYTFLLELGAGKHSRTYLVESRDKQHAVLKLCNLKQLSTEQEEHLTCGSASWKPWKPKTTGQFDKGTFLRNMTRFRQEGLVVCCLSGLSPFTVRSPTINSPTIICDLERGELGYAMEPLMINMAQFFHYWEVPSAIVDDSSEALGTFLQTVIFFAAQLADAVNFLHRCDIVHSNINATNVLVASDGYIKLGDFGRAHMVNNSNSAGVCRSSKSALTARVSESEGLSPVTPEKIWCKHWAVADRNKARAEANSRLGKHSDLFMLGTSLSHLDCPLKKVWKTEPDIQHAFQSNMTFDDFLKTAVYNHKGFAFERDDLILDYISQLTTADPTQRLGYNEPEALTDHPVFSGLDFGLLRAKLLIPPIWRGGS